jgi:cold shock CspA family protein
MRGRLKKWVGERGFGFFAVPGQEDVFVHGSQMGAATLTPHEGMWFEFELGTNRKHPGKMEAVRVRKLAPEESRQEEAWSSREPVKFGE